MTLTLDGLLKQSDRWTTPVLCALASFSGQFKRQKAHNPDCLVVRPGGMGDLICAHLALERIGVPLNAVRWLIQTRSEGWARHAGLQYQCVDRVNIISGLVSETYPLVVDTEQYFGLSHAIALMLRSAGGRFHGFTTNRASEWADTNTEYDPYDEHEVLAFSRLFAEAFGQSKPEPLLPIHRRIAATGRPIVGIAGQQEPTRALPLDRWVTLVQEFARGREFDIVAAPVDLDFATALADQFKGRAFLLRGNFDSVCKRIASSSELFTIDGGLVHVASFYGVPTTAVFTGGRYSKWAPLAEGSVILRRGDLQCQPCTLYGQVPRCPHQLACHQPGPSNFTATPAFQVVEAAARNSAKGQRVLRTARSL